MDKELIAARELARGAGAILMKHYRGSAHVEWKGPGDPVTLADREASEFLVRNLALLFPEHGILSEEETDNCQRLDRSHVWMVDPMDGTAEFIENRHEFAVMIGLAVNGIPIVGAVYQPTIDKLYYAAQGQGAFMEFQGASTPLRVSPERTASRVIIAVSRSHVSSRVSEICDRLQVKESIRMGSVGLKVGLICEARAHLYIHAGDRTNLWDTCGPEVILREAGGRMTDISNLPLRYTGKEVRNPNGLVASNSVMHERAIRVTQAVMKGKP
jgi:3'(2'), 5'-bisphosphate nucleotidase